MVTVNPVDVYIYYNVKERSNDSNEKDYFVI